MHRHYLHWEHPKAERPALLSCRRPFVERLREKLLAHDGNVEVLGPKHQVIVFFDKREHRSLEPAIMVDKSPPPAPPREWPKHFPADCPDTDAPDTNGDVFHFVFGDPNRDYKSAYERNLRKNALACQRVSLSCFIKWNDAVESRQIMQAMFGDAKIARAQLRPEHGKIKVTPTPTNPGHHSLWFRAKFYETRNELFEVLE